MGDVRHLVNKLYMALNVDQHQVMKERDILAQIEDLKSQLAPLEKVQRPEIIACNLFLYITILTHFRKNIITWNLHK